MRDMMATRFLGGSPLAVLIRLIVVSLLVGALMSWLGIDAADILRNVERGVLRLWSSGFAALGDIGRTLMAGALVVVPVWFVLRLLRYRDPRSRRDRDDVRDMSRGPAAHPQAPAAHPQAASTGAPRWSDPERVGDERRS